MVRWSLLHIYEQVGKANKRIVDHNGRTKVYHRNGLMQAGQRKEPTADPPLRKGGTPCPFIPRFLAKWASA